MRELTLVTVPVFGSAGAARNHEYFDIKKWREIAPIKNARPYDRYIATLVEGDSLIGDRIFDGDCVLIRLNFDIEEITPGKLVSVDTPAGTLIKHLYQTLNDRVRLVSSNSLYPAVVYDIDLVEIRGIIVRVERDID
jgi:SOS-response transcriptional repressor LexA